MFNLGNKKINIMKNKRLTLSEKLRDNMATILACTVAVANAWLNIDWEKFTFQKGIPVLLLSAIIAIGGVVSTVKPFKKKDNLTEYPEH